MSLIYSVLDGQDDLLARDLNQYRDTLANVIGVTDTTQAALGRMVMPRDTQPPASPTQGQVYYDTAQDAPFFFDGERWIRWGTVRQTIQLTNAADDAIGTSMGLTFSQAITTTGGNVLVIVQTYVFGTKNGTGTSEYEVEVRRDSNVVLARGKLRMYHVNGGFMDQTDQLMFLDIDLPPGTYTYGVYARNNGGWTSITMDGGGDRTRIILLELG